MNLVGVWLGISFFGDVNPHISVSVSAPPNVATMELIAEGGAPTCPWSIFQVHFGDITALGRSYVSEGVCPRQGEAPREWSRDGENKNGKKGNKGNKGGPKGQWRIYPKGYRGEPVTRCGRETWTVCIVHVHNGVKRGARRGKNSEACTLHAWLSKMILFVVVEIRHGTSGQNFTKKRADRRPR